MGIKSDLAKIVGKDYVSDKKEDLAGYSRDYSLLAPSMPDAVVWPGSSQEVGKVVAWCNEKNIPVVPVSSKVHFYGCTIPKQGGIVVDLKRMNKILEIDLDNRLARVEAGVTWEQFVAELEKKGMRTIMPLLPPGNRSVVTDTLERETPTNIVYDYGEPMQSIEVVWPNGDVFRCGSASVNGFPESKSRGANPSGPGLDFYRFFQLAQGTMGVVTWASLKIESIPRIDKIFFAPVNDLPYAMDFLYRILPRRIGQECLLLNNVDLAAIVADKVSEDFDKLCVELPPWTLVLVISGLLRRPEEKIAYEEHFLTNVLTNEFQKMALTDNLPGFPGLGRKLLPMLRKPWPSDVPYWKNRIKGGCQNLFFITKPNKVTVFMDIMEMVAAKYGYPASEIGSYIQPIEHNRACQIEFSFFYDPEDAGEKAFVSDLYRDAAITMMNEGAFFTRPYGDLAPIIYDRAAGYTMALKRVKKVFDPNNIMNPGNLCF
ncbi:MAG: putative FAD-linked oxidoreductase [Syntrophorhabdus sp. PtaU1.Bin058]|nr:MAG: putative FAD-linked oxidoreductase [Syntrophorhabdus sp. PtaU1.Bin058]